MKDKIELTDKELEKVSGGIIDPNTITRCPKCGSTNVLKRHNVKALDVDSCECHDCGHKFYVEKE